jgi:biotin operon repressor
MPQQKDEILAVITITINGKRIRLASQSDTQQATSTNPVRRYKKRRGVRKYKHWTPDDDARLVDLYKQKISSTEIARVLGCSPTAVMTRATTLRSKGAQIPALRLGGRQSQK